MYVGEAAASTVECVQAGKEHKQLIQMFTDSTLFGDSLLEQASNMIIQEPDTKLS